MSLGPFDLRLIQTLARFRFCTASLLCDVVGDGKPTTTVRPYVSRRLKHLRELELVETVRTIGREHLYYLTEAGAEFAHTEGGRTVGVKLSEYAHDLALARLCVSLENNWEKQLLTERQIRALDLDPTSNEYALKVTRANGNTGWAWPDLVAEENGQRIGYEVEWTRKNRRRLLLLMHSYGYSTNYDMAVYFTNDATHHFVSECALDANTALEARGKGRPITVRPLSKYIDVPESLI